MIQAALPPADQTVVLRRLPSVHLHCRMRRSRVCASITRPCLITRPDLFFCRHFANPPISGMSEATDNCSCRTRDDYDEQYKEDQADACDKGDQGAPPRPELWWRCCQAVCFDRRGPGVRKARSVVLLIKAVGAIRSPNRVWPNVSGRSPTCALKQSLCAARIRVPLGYVEMSGKGVRSWTPGTRSACWLLCSRSKRDCCIKIDPWKRPRTSLSELSLSCSSWGRRLHQRRFRCVRAGSDSEFEAA